MLSINPRVPLSLAIVAGLAMVGITAWQGYSFWQTDINPAVHNGAPATQLPKETSSTPAVPLASLALFGTAQTQATEEAQSTEDLPETNLRLYLRGVLASEGEFPGSALIEDDKRKTEAYLVGQELPGNATLHSVFANRVILDRAGKLENLYFPEPDDQSGMTFSSDSNNVRQTTTATNRPASSQPAANQQQRREEIRNRLELLRERLRTN